MSKKKQKKSRHAPSVSAAELVKLAEEKLRGGQADEALTLLQRAEAEIRRAASSVAVKGAPLPPHLARLQPLLAPLLARALFERAAGDEAWERKLADLEEAVRRAPGEVRYLLALGACRLALGKPEPALELFRKAQQIAPGDALAERALALGLLGGGRTGEFRDWLQRRPAEGHRPEGGPEAWVERLATLRELTAGDFALGGARRTGGAAAPAPRKGTKAGRPGSAETSRVGDFQGQLLDSLLGLASGDGERARKQLATRPRLGRAPSRAEAAVLATQLFYSGALRFQADRLPEAAADLSEAQRLARTHAVSLPWLERLPSYYHQIATLALERDELPLALECWRRVLELCPEDRAAAANLATARRVRANQAWRAGEIEQAVALWQESLQASPEDERLLRNLAIGSEKLGRKEEAVTYWRALAERGRQQTKDRKTDERLKERLVRLEQHLVDLLLELDRPPYEIQNELNAALSLDPANDTLRRRSAELFLEIGRPQQALKQLEAIERHQGASADVLTMKGLALEMAGRWAAARDAFERALELDSSHAGARASLMLMLGREAMEAEEDDDLAAAVELCREQLEIDPNFLPALRHMATLYFELDENDEAEQTIARLIATSPESPQRHVMAGSIYLEFDFNRKAETAFKHAIEIEPSEQCFFYVGNAYLEADLVRKAVQYFKRAVRVGTYRTLLAVAEALISGPDPGEAASFLEMAMKQRPDDPEPHLARAVMLMGEGEMERALDAVTEAERLASRRPEFSPLLANARELRREIEETEEKAAAVSEFEQLLHALENAPRDMPLPGDLRRRLAQLEKRL